MQAGGPIRNTRQHRYRRVVFTLNNWTSTEYASLVQWKPTWLVVGKEVGEDGTPHLQGAAILGSQMTMTQLKKLPGLARAHFEPMMGTPQHSLTYCSKQDQAAYTFGTMPSPGKRNDLEACYTSLKDGATMRQLADEHGVEVIKYSKGLMITRSLLVEPRVEPPKVFWIFGPTGLGKTRAAVDLAVNRFGGEYWMSPGGLQWFDGYDGQSVAILDDFRGKHCSFPFLLRLLDRYPFRVPFKGGYVEWTPRVIIITCPYSPREIFEVRGKHLPEDINQLERRITKVIEVKPGVSFEFLYSGLLAQVFPRMETAPAAFTTYVDLTDVDDGSDLEELGDGPDGDSDGESLETWLTK